jgi:hypothetical protein
MKMRQPRRHNKLARAKLGKNNTVDATRKRCYGGEMVNSFWKVSRFFEKFLDWCFRCCVGGVGGVG